MENIANKISSSSTIPVQLGSYALLTVIIIFLFITFSHFISYTKITNEPLSILQSEHPMPDVIESMMSKRQPIIYLYELELWDGIDLMIGYPYAEINQVLTDNKELIKTIKTTYLRPFSLTFTKDWRIILENKSDIWDVLPNYPTREMSYGHFIANLSGLLVVCLIHPSLINKNSALSIPQLIKSGFDFKTALTTQTTDTIPIDNNITQPQFDYITVPIRPSNMIYIPYGWYYWIYCGQPQSYCTYLDIYNITWFG